MVFYALIKNWLLKKSTYLKRSFLKEYIYCDIELVWIGLKLYSGTAALCRILAMKGLQAKLNEPETSLIILCTRPTVFLLRNAIIWDLRAVIHTQILANKVE